MVIPNVDQVSKQLAVVIEEDECRQRPRKVSRERSVEQKLYGCKKDVNNTKALTDPFVGKRLGLEKCHS